MSELLGGMPGWRGRAQQITNLQNRVAELKRQVKVLEGQRSGRGDLEGGGEKERGRIRQLEQKRRNELEVCVCLYVCMYVRTYVCACLSSVHPFMSFFMSEVVFLFLGAREAGCYRQVAVLQMASLDRFNCVQESMIK